MFIDLSSDFGARVANRLRDELILWLTTTGADGTPQPNPVWFLWTDETVVIVSEPAQSKIRNIERTPRVSLNFNSDRYGGNVAVIVGTATVDPNPLTAAEADAYGKKYAEGIKSIGLTQETMLAQYSTVLRVTPTKLRGF